MNRYPRPPMGGGGASRATAATLCQKCLKKDRLVFPRFMYKTLTSITPLLLRMQGYCTREALCSPPISNPAAPEPQAGAEVDKKGVADEQLAKAEAERERGRKRERQSNEPESAGKPKRMRSASASSVSTISTNVSRSPSPRQARPTSLSRSPSRTELGRQDRRYSSISQSPPSRPPAAHEKKRRRESQSSVGSPMSNTGDHAPHSRERGSSRSTRRRYRHVSPPARGRKAEIRSPQRRRRFSDDREPGRDDRNGGLNPNSFNDENRQPPREKSLSPFSKRLALTQSRNMGR
ncbi:hypothetical protein LOCC1_G005208 [Lachnellula occidentalis]|uniref:Uncharacterized protein n=1 Tax=Lachnellula occidentalis TaxID=215460 RepID=A0A8H8UBI8_9HELO|nr:hypothetical protein LOCC1_G005208 [Lachnellula occidentalis]